MSKTIYLLLEKGLPFPPKWSTFSIKKVYLFCRIGRPFLKEPLIYIIPYLLRIQEYLFKRTKRINFALIYTKHYKELWNTKRT